jgi:hypothetical protein
MIFALAVGVLGRNESRPTHRSIESLASKVATRENEENAAAVIVATLIPTRKRQDI